MLQATRDAPGAQALPGDATAPTARHLRHVLLWPLRLISTAADDSEDRRAPWRALRALGEASPWREHFDEFTGDSEGFHERHYNEFVAFLPYVQRFLYGAGRTAREGDEHSERSPMRVFRRHDIHRVRVQPRPSDPCLTLDVVHVDLYFFYGVDIVLLNVEVAGDELPLPLAEELMYRFGRAYPAGWYADGRPQHTLTQCEWLDRDGRVLAASDARERDAFIAHVAEHRAPRIAAHWEYVLAPLVSHHSAQDGALRFRQIEYYRMPMMAYLAVDDPAALTRSDFVRLGLVTGAGESRAPQPGLPDERRPPEQRLPYAEQHLEHFEERYCYDRFWSVAGAAPYTRYLCSGLSLVVIGDADSPFYRCGNRGVLAQFRHQHFLLFLIAHFQKATLLMVSDQPAKHPPLQAPHPHRLRRVPVVHPPLLVPRSQRAGAGEGAVAHVPRSSRDRAAVRRGQGAHRRHEQLSRRRRAAAPGQHRGAADGGDDLRPDRHRHHRLSRHEPVCRKRRLLDHQGIAVPAGIRADDRADLLHDRQIEAPVGLSRHGQR
jgi:hypothetical protein